MHTTDVLLNDFAIRCFRDTADQDYIAARLAFRSRLVPQFLWSGLQALEKYLKCILVLNRIRANNGHDLAEVLRAFEEAKPFELRLSEEARKFIGFLDTYGRYRYFESSWYVLGEEFVELDRAVWEVRRYARLLNYKMTVKDREGIDAMPIELRVNIEAEARHPQEFRIAGGLLESILDKRDHPARSALVWQNGFFGNSRRRTVRVASGLQAANSPLTLRPHLIDEVLKFVWLPKYVAEAYRQRAAQERRSEAQTPKAHRIAYPSD